MAIKAYLRKDSRTVAKLRSPTSLSANARDILNIVKDYSNAPLYTGEYTVTPKAFEAQSLPTTDKLLTRDVTVFEIPYFETSNLSGGSTVYISSEVELNG